jgi:capsid protein
VVLTNPDGTDNGIGVTEAGEDSTSPLFDRIGAGTVHIAPPGHEVTIVQPPKVDDFGPFSEVTLRTIAAGIGVPYEGMTGDYGDMPFSAARMARLAYWARVEDWRWQTLIPQFCDPVWMWAMEVGTIMGRVRSVPVAEWTAPPPPMVDPDVEGRANLQLIRSGQSSLSEVLRGRGYNPKTVLLELASDLKLLDELGLVLDSDARKMTQAGQLHSGGANEEPDPLMTPKRPNGKPVPANGRTK